MRGESVTEWCQCVYRVVHALSDANVDAPTNASVAFDHFVGLLILTVCVETVGSRLCSSYIYFVSSQYVSDPINSIIFSCALLACETDPVTCRPHVWLGVAQLRQRHCVG